MGVGGGRGVVHLVKLSIIALYLPSSMASSSRQRIESNDVPKPTLEIRDVTASVLQTIYPPPPSLLSAGGAINSHSANAFHPPCPPALLCRLCVYYATLGEQLQRRIVSQSKRRNICAENKKCQVPHEPFRRLSEISTVYCLSRNPFQLSSHFIYKTIVYVYTNCLWPKKILKKEKKTVVAQKVWDINVPLPPFIIVVLCRYAR